MKLLITSYYSLRESLLSAANSLRNLDIIVIDFPLKVKNDNIKNDFNNFIKQEKPDIILWWCMGISIADMKYVIENNKNVKNIYFNWDDPYNWNIYNDIADRCKYFDYSFICCEQSIEKYLKNESKNVKYLLPGYDPLIHNIIVHDNPSDIQKYSCDISFCCTNLYADDQLFPNQYINRKKLVDDIYNNQEHYNFTFHIYGPEFLNKLYPKSYKGYIKYNDTNKLFNYSKINLCTHVQSNAFKYLNERSILILGAGGFLYVDLVDGIEQIIKPNEECIIIDKNNYLNQIKNILNNYDKYYLMRHNGHKKSIKFTWDNWASQIYDGITNIK